MAARPPDRLRGVGRPGRAELPEGERRRRRRAAHAALGRRPVDVPPARDRRPAGGRGRRALVGPLLQGRDRVAPVGGHDRLRHRHRPRRRRLRARRRLDDDGRPAGALLRRGRRACDEHGVASGQRLRRGRRHLPRQPGAGRGRARADRRRRPALRRRLHAERGEPRLPRRPGLRDALCGHRPLAAQPGRPAEPGAGRALGRLGRRRHRHPELRPRRHGPRPRPLPGARRRHRGLVGADRLAGGRRASAAS